MLFFFFLLINKEQELFPAKGQSMVAATLFPFFLK